MTSEQFSPTFMSGAEASFDDLHLHFKPDVETVSVIYTDRNGNDLFIGKLTKAGAIRLIARIAKIFDIPLEMKQ